MHGIVHQRLKEYVVEKTDETGWETVLRRAGVERRLYLPVSHYPDEEVEIVLKTVAAMSDHDAAVVERDFGRFLAPALLRTFRAHVRDDWEVFDLLASLEELYATIESNSERIDPPNLTCERVADRDEVHIAYRSARDHCSMGRGIIEGLLREYGASATVIEASCRREGDDECAFLVRGNEVGERQAKSRGGSERRVKDRSTTRRRTGESGTKNRDPTRRALRGGGNGL